MFVRSLSVDFELKTMAVGLSDGSVQVCMWDQGPSEEVHEIEPQMEGSCLRRLLAASRCLRRLLAASRCLRMLLAASRWFCMLLAGSECCLLPLAGSVCCLLPHGFGLLSCS